MPGPSASMLQAASVAQDIKDLDTAAMAALKPVIAQAQAELAAKLQAWVAKLGPNAATEKYTAAQIQQLYLSLGIASSQLAMPKGNFPTVVADAVKKTLGTAQTPTAAIATLDAQLSALKAKFADLAIPDLTRAAWFAKGDKLLLDHYTKSATRYAGNVKQDLKLQFGVGLASGETVNELTKRIANLSSFKTAVDASLGPKKAGAAMAAGLSKRYEHWAERLVRTEIANAYNYAAVEGIKHVHSVDDRVEMRWDASLDKRVCPFCAKLHDTRAKVGDLFPGGIERPPAHPYCRCAVVAWIEEDWGANAKPAPEVTMTAEEAAKKDAAKKAAETKAKKKAEKEAAAKKAAEEAAAKKKAEEEAKKKAAEEAAKKAAEKAAAEAAAKKAAEEAAALQAKMKENVLADTKLPVKPGWDFTGVKVPPLSKDSPAWIGPTNHDLKGKGAAQLQAKGLVKLGDNMLAGHGNVWEWAPIKPGSSTKAWKHTVKPYDHGVVYDYTTKSWVPKPPPAAPSTPPPAPAAPKPAPKPVAAPLPPPPPQPKAIFGHEWKLDSKNAWVLHKDGVPAISKMPAYNPNTSPSLEASYGKPQPLLQAGLVTIGEGTIAGHGYVFKLEAGGVNWNMVEKAGKPVTAPSAATSTAPKPKTSTASRPATPPPPAPATWTPNAINLATNRKGVVDFNSFTSSHFGGLHGAAFSTDGDAVESGSVRVVKVKGADGKEYYEAVFKLTHPYGDRARQLGSGTGDWTFRQRSLKSGNLVDSGSEHVERIKTKIATGNGYRMEIGETGAVRNAVRIRATSLKDLNGAMDNLSQHLGVDTRKVPTKEDLVLQAKAKIAAKVDPVQYGRLMENARTPEAQKQVIEQVWSSASAKAPWMNAALADAKEVEVYPGKKTLFSESMGKHFAEQFGHMVHAGSPPPSIAASIISDTGLMSSNKRFNSGIFTTGMSTSQDFATGGADGVFMRLQSAAKVSGSSGGRGFRVEIDTAQVMGRMDWWAFNHDNYGRAGYDNYNVRWATAEMKKGRETGGNEVMAPDGVPPSAIRRMVCGSASYRDEVLAALRSQGITKINGKKIEDVVVTGGR